MWDRTLSVYSAGKTFSVTAWKIGWVVARRELLSRLQIAQQWVCFSVATPLQEAVARGLAQARHPYEGYPTYYAYLAALYERKRARMVAALEAAGLPVIVPQGTFFVLADTSALAFSNSPPQAVRDLVAAGRLQVDPATLTRRDYNFARRLAVHSGVTPIPPSGFYSPDHAHLGANFARFAFCKRSGGVGRRKRR
jgi:aspartate/methionine/tyrosine aminotransferase